MYILEIIVSETMSDLDICLSFKEYIDAINFAKTIVDQGYTVKVYLDNTYEED